VLAFLLSLLPLTGHAGDSPDWAFPGCPLPPKTPTAETAKPFSVPGSSRTASAAELAHADVTVDWFPEEHAPLPRIVATHPGKAGCGYCHLPDGSGRPENAKLAGLPAAYIVAQLKALREGTRTPVRPDWLPSRYMVQFAGGIDDQELAAAAAYFASIPARSYVRVVEARTVPSIEVKCFTYGPGPGSAVPLGTRILEVPVDVERFERRDPHTAYIAYVPVGSIERGRRLASGASPGRPAACAACHGAALAGDEALPGPPLAGRFPGYLFRQLYGFRSGARGGDAAAPMRAVVAGLNDANLVDLAAYAASLKP
jgi:cytochrome c553